MEVSVPLIALGLVMTSVGAIMVLLSLNPGEGRSEARDRGVAVIFIGPIPIVFGGRGRWIIIGIAVAAVIALLLFTASHPDLPRW